DHPGSWSVGSGRISRTLDRRNGHSAPPRHDALGLLDQLVASFRRLLAARFGHVPHPPARDALCRSGLVISSLPDAIGRHSCLGDRGTHRIGHLIMKSAYELAMERLAKA